MCVALAQEKWYINTDPFLHYTETIVSVQCKYSVKMAQYLYAIIPALL